MNLNKILAITAIAATLVAGLTISTGIAGAWHVDQSASAVCDGPTPIVTVPVNNNDSRTMNIDVYVEAQHQELTGLQAGGSHTFKFSFQTLNLAAGTASVTYTWADGGSGSDTRTANYIAVNCVAPTTTTTTVAPTTTMPDVQISTALTIEAPPVPKMSAPAKPVKVTVPLLAG